MMKYITRKEAEKLGVRVDFVLSKNRYYLRDDGCVVDDYGKFRFIPAEVLNTVENINELRCA